MDLGISGRRAIVCGSSRGLGRACAEALVSEGVHVVLNGRDALVLEEARAAIADRAGVEVTAVAGDVGDPDVRAALMKACPEVDILVTNNAGPSPGRLADWGEVAWRSALEANLIAPLMLIRAAVDGMVERKFGRIINVTSAMVTSPDPEMGLSAGARAGLHGALKSLSRSVAAHNVTINNLLPERFDTERQVQMAKRTAAQQGISYDEARAVLAATVAAGRFGRPEEFGATCAFLCGEHSGYTSGNNIHLDGGSYVGLI